jgi:hypothetical protein
MEFAYAISGASPHLKKYQIAATVSNAGVPLLIPAADGAGLAAATTTSMADLVGCNIDTATYVTAQQTDGTSAERTVSVIVNPDAVWKALMSGGATEGTALTLYDVTTASSTGLVVTTGDSWTSPEFDEGVVWDYDGANVGQARKITSTSSTAATVTVAFNNDTVVGNNFMRAPYWPPQTLTVQLTTNLYQADASIAVATGAQAKAIELILNDLSESGRTNSYVLFVSTDHVYAARPT